MNYLLWLAVLPSIFLAYRVLSYDRVEKEPVGLLIKLFIFGMLTCIPAAIIEAVGEMVISGISPSDLLTSALTYLLLVPLAEEGMKLLALRTTHDDPNFNYTFDGIVYGVMVTLGFATLENVLYVLSFQTVETAIMRAIISVPMHCVCGIFMGYYYGVARGQEARGSEDQARLAYRLCLLIPCIIHGLFDFSVDQESLIVVLLGLAFTLFVFFVAAKQVKISSQNDQPIAASLSAISEPVSTEPDNGGAKRSGGTPPPPFNMQ